MGDISDAMAERAGRTYRGATIAWGEGRAYDFDNPNPEIVTLEDAAYALAYTVRWRGQTRCGGRRAFYGVGQHCVFGAEEMLAHGYDWADALAFLFHEPDEIVLPDFPGPAKLSLPGFREFARRHGNGFLRRFDISIMNPDLIKAWDLRMMVTEKRDLMPGHGPDRFHTSDRVTISEDEFPPFERRIRPYPHPDQAAARFLALARRLRPDIG